MTYLIDGHNLVPKLPGMSLQHLDDEQQLVTLLQQFCLRQRRRVVVYFDRAVPGQAGKRAFGQVEAHFVRQGVPADRAIIGHLRRQGKGASNWTVVTSDRVVAAEARALRAAVLAVVVIWAVVRWRRRRRDNGGPGPAEYGDEA